MLENDVSRLQETVRSNANKISNLVDELSEKSTRTTELEATLSDLKNKFRVVKNTRSKSTIRNRGETFLALIRVVWALLRWLVVTLWMTCRTNYNRCKNWNFKSKSVYHTELDFSKARKLADYTRLVNGLPPYERIRLRHCHKVTVLRASHVNDISVLPYYPNLEQLSLRFYGDITLTCISNLTKLTKLDLRNPVFDDISPLRHLTNLQMLAISSSKVIDLSPLSCLINLQMLNLSGTGVVDTTPLQQLKQLHTLDLSHTKVQHIKPLLDLTSLKYLSLDHTRVDDSEVLGQLRKSLVTLTARCCPADPYSISIRFSK
ncbi:hypothetical protein GEMRC1_005983 [Eukaryota sp. GEM-RC1]